MSRLTPMIERIRQMLDELEQLAEDQPSLIPSSTRAAYGKRKRMERMPVDWVPPSYIHQWASTLLQSEERATHETDQFRDYWISRGTSRADWTASYRNWIRKAAVSPAAFANGQGRSSSRTAAIGADNRAKRNRVLDKLHALRDGDGPASAPAAGHRRTLKAPD